MRCLLEDSGTNFFVGIRAVRSWHDSAWVLVRVKAIGVSNWIRLL